MSEIRENQPGVENSESPIDQPQAPELVFPAPDCAAEEAVTGMVEASLVDTSVTEVAQPLVEAAPAPVTKRRPVGLIVAGIVLLVLALLAGGAFFGLRYYESNSLQVAQTSYAQKDWAAAEAAIAQGLSLQQTGLMVDPNQFILLRGKVRYEQGRYEEALVDLAAMEGIFTSDVDIPLIKTYIYLKTDRFEDALTSSGQALALNPQLGLPYALQAVKAYHEFRYGDAVTAAAAAIDRDSTLEMAYWVRGSVLAWQMDKEAALSDLNKALELQPDQVEALAARTFLSYYSLDYEKLKADAQSLKTAAPDSAYALWAEGMVNLFDYKENEARALFDQAIAKDSSRPEFFSARAASYIKTEDEKLALADTESALKIDPDFAISVSDKAFYAFSRYETVDMNAEADRLAKLSPKSYLSNMLRGAQYVRDLEWDKALAEYELAIKAQPNPIVGYLTRGDLYLAQNKFDLALADYQKALELFPQSTSARFGIARIYHQKNKFDDALKVLDEIAAINPDSLDMFSLKAMVQLGKEDKRQAAKTLEEAVKVDPFNAGVLVSRALVSLANEDSMKAMSDVNKAAGFYPNDPSLMVFRAMVYMSNGDTKQAQTELRNAEKINKKLEGIFITRAMIHMGAGEYSRAMENAKKAISLSPWSAEAYGIVGEAQYYLDRRDLAIESMKKSIELDPEQDHVYYTLGLALWEDGDLEGAVESFEKLIANKRKSSLELVNHAEPLLSFLRRVPAAVDGKRIMEDSIDGYRITFPVNWIPEPPSEVANIANFKLELSPKDKRNSVHFSIMVDELEITGIPASVYADYFLTELSEFFSGYKYISTEYFQGENMTGVVKTFELMYHETETASYPARQRMYVFASGKKFTLIFFSSDVLYYEDFIQEADDIAKSFQFVD